MAHFKEPNEIRYDEWGGAFICLSEHRFAIIDAADVALVSPYRWHIGTHGRNKRPYAAARSGKIRLHRFLLGDPEGMLVDHINHNTLDCRRSNLRVASHAQNAFNCSPYGALPFKGVSFNKQSRKFRAKIQIAGSIIWLGSFPTAEEAARAYDDAAIRHHGDFSVRNFRLPAPAPSPSDRSAA